mmetsp:Transcript_18566/g.57860  ORF Transcript_18566/g.57860 Transcript_18566/m.57860 type:complete len:233 (-) Transcript_18566:103-801(-)
MPAGLKKSAKSAMRCHPRSRTAGLSATVSKPESRAWKRSASTSYAMIAGGCARTPTIVSTTSNEPLGLCTKAASPNAPSRERKVPSSVCSSWRCQGRPAELSGSLRTSAPAKPSQLSGKLSGNAYWPGRTHSAAPRPTARANGPANTLCSTPRVGSTTCRTRPCSASSSRTSRMHSRVGATGQKARSASSPACSSAYFTIVIRTGTCTYRAPWSWSKVQTWPLTTSVRSVLR